MQMTHALTYHMMQRPPDLDTISLLEVMWVLAAAIGTYLSVRAWWRATRPRTKLKSTIRTVACAVLMADGCIAMATPPPATPTWLSVMNPIAVTIGVTAMALLTVVDVQVKE